MSEENVFIGRQPIVDSRERVLAHEILYRAGADSQTAVFDDANQAAAQVVVNTFVQLGPDAVFGEGLGFFNVTEQVLESRLIEVLPPEKIVVEILETVEPSLQVIRDCERLRKLGYRLALDDYVPGDPREEMLSMVDWVKVDLLATDPKKLKKLVRRLRRHRPRLLAEKVEDRAEFERCKAMGFDAYQGFYFARPQVMSGRAPSTDSALLLDLLGRIQAEADNREIVESLKPHAGLSMGLLRIANSASMGRAQRLSRVEDALIYLGRRQLQRWVAILLFAHNRPGGHRDPLLVMAAKRGRLMELLAAVQGSPVERCEQAFLVGVLASIEALLGRPCQEVVSELHLAPESEAALIGHDGPLGTLLSVTEASEQCAFDRLDKLLEEAKIAPADFQTAENEAYAWVHGLSQGLAA